MQWVSLEERVRSKPSGGQCLAQAMLPVPEDQDSSLQR